MISDKTKLPLGFAIFLASAGIGMASAAAVANYRISATSEAQAALETDVRSHESRLQRLETSFEYISRSLDKIDRKLDK